MVNDPELKSIYNSMSSSCGYTGLPATKTVTGLIVASPTGTRKCDSTYTAKSGDTALSVSLAQNVATHDLVTANGLNYTSLSSPVSGSLCIRNQCNVYVLQAGDTCRSIGDKQKISLAQLLSWNPPINGRCDNIGGMVGQTICVSNPLGDFRVNNNTDTAAITTPAPVPADLGFEVNTNCGIYHDIKGGDDCGTIGLKYSISLDDFLFLNPNVWENCTNLWLDYSYCVAPVGNIKDYPGYGGPTPTFSIVPAAFTKVAYKDPWEESGRSIIIPMANDTRVDCWDYLWWNTSFGFPVGCWSLAEYYELSPEQLVLWNPSLDANPTDAPAESKTYNYDCTIQPSVKYCVALASPTPYVPTVLAPPSPRATGEIANCTQWFVSSLSCDIHITLLRMTLDKFYRFNPSVKPDCSGFVLGTYYCWSIRFDNSVDEDDGSGEGISSTETSSPPTSTSAGGGLVTPTPTQAGMVSNCDTFYKVKSGDGCWAIANANQIDLNDFYQWNPAVKTDCSGLQADVYVCVGIASTTTTTTLASSAASSPTGAPVSSNGLCGASNGGMTCQSSQFGDCCSSSGYCGSSSDYCGTGCQIDFGTCSSGGGPAVSSSGLCGASNGGMTCQDSQFGDCCSSSGYCGASSDYCGGGCQAAFGICS